MTNIKRLYDSLPANDDFDESVNFDSFLVGDGSAQLMKKSSKDRSQNSSNQLMGIFDVGDLVNSKEDECEIEAKDDLDEFAIDPIPVDSPVEDYFFSIKKKYFDLFDYLIEKSKQLVGRPIRERDLVLNNDDSYLLKYIESHEYVSDQLLNQLAQLSACKDMGFVRVVFYPKESLDNCPLCKAHKGTVYYTNDLLNKIGSGEDFIHEGCACTFIPVLQNRKELAHIKYGLTLTAYVGDVYFERLPIEYANFLSVGLLNALAGCKVCFVDFSDEKKIEELELSPDDVVVESGDSIYVRDSYLGSFSPLDFLEQWVFGEETRIMDVSEDSSEEVFYLNGVKVVERNGKYMDESGNIVDLFGGKNDA